MSTQNNIAAQVEMHLVADSGYVADYSNRISADQWGDLIRVAEGSLSTEKYYKAQARVEVAEAGYKAAVEKAEWQARTNAELNALTIERDKLVAKRDSLLEVLKPFVAAYNTWGGENAALHFGSAVVPMHFRELVKAYNTALEGDE